uniref:Uncharacterized protein n=1 Tax=Oryza brachyantha TaxID=4533 RepID=J3MGS6_ORYBR
MGGRRDEMISSSVVAAGSNGKAPAPPPPPRHHEAVGGHRRGQRRRRRPRRVRVAIGLMLTAAGYLVFSEAFTAPAAAPPSPGWFFMAFVLWISGLIMLYVSNMN